MTPVMDCPLLKVELVKLFLLLLCIENLGKFVCKTLHDANGNKKNKLDTSNIES